MDETLTPHHLVYGRMHHLVYGRNINSAHLVYGLKIYGTPHHLVYGRNINSTPFSIWTKH